MADSEAVDVNIAGSVNGDSSEFDGFPAKMTEAKGVAGDDHHLKARIEELEQEKRELTRENEVMKAAVEQMAQEKEAKLGEIKEAARQRDDLEMKAMESITKRAFELEGEVSRLQHDLGTAMNSGDEANRQVERLTREVRDLISEKSALSEKLSTQAEEFKKSESESKNKISELEKKIEALQQSESELKREASLVEEQANARLNELKSEIALLKKEKTAVEDTMATLESELKKSETKVIQMAERLDQLAQNTQESEEIIAGMVEKAAKRGIDGIGERDAGLKGLKNKVTLPVAGAVSAGVVVAALAVFYLKFSKTSISLNYRREEVGLN